MSVDVSVLCRTVDRWRLRARSFANAFSTRSPGVLGGSLPSIFAVGRHDEAKSFHQSRSGRSPTRQILAHNRENDVL
ncbi:Uncharacterized protein FWK35_00012301 [Aphis craccivora]|uniref:Uncharacterized protein n=1 Tax=Aphis craccivora TaxID=307492 RepID=A0A6G0Z464_APHCR|nr:Uncharacterized protein FWK35_00012301 [Aphis craccivora]